MSRQMKKIILIIFMAFILINTISYAEIKVGLEDKTSSACFEETVIDIDNIEADNENTILEHKIKKIMGFNSICTPYILIIAYLVVEIMLIKKHKNLKYCMSVSLITILLIFVLNNIIEKPVSEIHFCNIVINSLILIIGLIYQKRMIKKYSEEDVEKVSNRMKILIVILAIISVIIYKIPKVRVVEEVTGGPFTIETRTYNIMITEGKSIEKPNLKVIKVNKDGVLIEYNSGYYERTEKDNSDSMIDETFGNYDYKEEVVQQKILWNTNYAYYEPRNPLIDYGGGTDYYIRFEK